MMVVGMSGPAVICQCSRTLCWLLEHAAPMALSQCNSVVCVDCARTVPACVDRAETRAHPNAHRYVTPTSDVVFLQLD
jgi:hypothetical protein